MMPFLQVYLDEYNIHSTNTYTMDELVNEINCHKPFLWFQTMLYYQTVFSEAPGLLQIFIAGFEELTNQYADGTGKLHF